MNKKIVYILIAAFIIILVIALIVTRSNKQKTASVSQTAIPVAVSHNNPSEGYYFDPSGKTIVSKNNQTGEKKIYTNFNEDPRLILPSPGGDELLIITKEDKFYLAQRGSQSVSLLENARSAVWLQSGDLAVYKKSDTDKKGTLAIFDKSGQQIKTKITESLSETATVVPSGSKIYFSVQENPDQDMFVNNYYNQTDRKIYGLSLPKDQSLVSISPSEKYYLLSKPNLTLKGYGIYNPSGNLVKELTSTPFVDSFQFADDDKLLYIKDQNEPKSEDSLNGSLVPNEVAIFTISSGKEASIFKTQNSQTIKSFDISSENKITVLLSNGETSEAAF